MNAARKSMLFREVNERIAELLARAWQTAPGDFLCECGREACTRRVTLTLPEYEAIGREGGAVRTAECAGSPKRPAAASPRSAA